jgi:hypothetical protein
MAPRQTATIQDLIDRSISASMGQIMGKLEQLEIGQITSKLDRLKDEVDDLKREVRQSNSRTITSPSKALTIPLNPYTYSLIAIVVLAVILAIAGQSSLIPAVVGKIPPPPVAGSSGG